MMMSKCPARLRPSLALISNFGTSLGISHPSRYHSDTATSKVSTHFSSGKHNDILLMLFTDVSRLDTLMSATRRLLSTRRVVTF